MNNKEFSEAGKKNYLIDIDGTITEDVDNSDIERMKVVKPFPDALETLNRWYDEGHVITFFTSRTDEHKEITIKWLDDNGFKYSGIMFNKPRFGNYHWIDNLSVKATTYKGVFSDLIESVETIEVFKK